jgi:hypothetical protein
MYFDILEKTKDPNTTTVYGTQNNYLQINNTIIKQETIRQLSPEQLKQIEEMVEKSLKVEVGESMAEGQ